MIIDTIDHEEATIQCYMREPDFAEYMLHSAILEGDLVEARKIQHRMIEAWKRTHSGNQAVMNTVMHEPVTA